MLRLAVLPLLAIAPEDSVTRSDALAIALPVCSRRVGVELVSEEERFTISGREQEIESCGSDAACITNTIAAAQLDLALVVVVDYLNAPARVSARLYGAKQGRIESASAEVADRRSHEALEHAVRDAVGSVLDTAGFVRFGTLWVETNPPGAAIAISPAPPLEAGPRLALPPGAYVITAALEGYKTASAHAEVASGAEQRVRIELEPEGEDSIAASPWFWVAIGAAALAAVAVGVGVASASKDTCYCLAGIDDPCPPDC